MDIDPDTASRATREYLATLDDASYGRATKVTPKFVSPADPATQWTGAKRDKAISAYSDNYLIDVKFGIIVDVEASRAIRQAEVEASRRMITRTEQSFGIKPEWLAADPAYGNALNLNWLVNDKQIDPYIPVVDKSERTDGTFSRSHFRSDPKLDYYFCPAGCKLNSSGKPGPDDTYRYRSRVSDCKGCSFKPICCPKTPQRRVPRHIFEPARDVARVLAKTDAHERAGHNRRKVEMLLAHLKRILGLNRLRLRGPKGAQNEFTLAAIAQNLRRSANLKQQMVGAA